MKKAAAQECVWQLFFIITGYDDDGTILRLDQLLRFIDIEFHAVEFLQQVIRKLDVRLVDLVDQQHGLHVGLECFPQLAANDVVRDVVDTIIAKL